MTTELARREPVDAGAVTAEVACLLVTVTAAAVALYEVVTSPAVRDALYRPFVLALSALPWPL